VVPNWSVRVMIWQVWAGLLLFLLHEGETKRLRIAMIRRGYVDFMR